MLATTNQIATRIIGMKKIDPIARIPMITPTTPPSLVRALPVKRECRADDQRSPRRRPHWYGGYTLRPGRVDQRRIHLVPVGVVAHREDPGLQPGARERERRVDGAPDRRQRGQQPVGVDPAQELRTAPRNHRKKKTAEHDQPPAEGDLVAVARVPPST